MGEGPTNAVLATLIEGGNKLNVQKFESLQKELDGISDHLKKLNGKTNKNTKHREKVQSYWKLIVFIFSIPSIALTILTIVRF